LIVTTPETGTTVICPAPVWSMVIAVPIGNGTDEFKGTFKLTEVALAISIILESSFNDKVYEPVAVVVPVWKTMLPVRDNDVPVAAPMFGVVKVTDAAIFDVPTAAFAISALPIAPASKLLPALNPLTYVAIVLQLELCSEATIGSPLVKEKGIVTVAMIKYLVSYVV
jgi:hypothetical protein